MFSEMETLRLRRTAALRLNRAPLATQTCCRRSAGPGYRGEAFALSPDLRPLELWSQGYTGAQFKRGVHVLNSIRLDYTLNLNNSTSPSRTAYSLPSMR